MQILDMEHNAGLDRATIRFYEKKILWFLHGRKKEFSYDYDNDGMLKGVHFEDTWQNPNYMDAVPNYCRCAIFVFAGSRQGCTYEELIRLEGEIESNLYDIFELVPESSSNSITETIYIADVQITWNVHMMAFLLFMMESFIPKYNHQPS